LYSKYIAVYFDNPIKCFENLALDDEILKQLSRIIKSYVAYHLDIGELKSESFLAGKIE
jgi:DNA repair protein RecO (recombination protein O)